MYHLYLDESGDLGHDVQNTGASRYFVITILETDSNATRKAIEKAVTRTMKHKVLRKKSRQRKLINELKGSKTDFAIQQFNTSLRAQLESRIPLSVPLDINHYTSHENKLLQAVDLFSWGIYRKYEAGDTEWYDVFREKIAFEEVHPENKKENGP